MRIDINKNKVENNIKAPMEKLGNIAEDVYNTFFGNGT